MNRIIPLFLAAALFPFQSLQQSGRQPMSPSVGDVERIRLGGGVPRDSMILGETPTAPPGYKATGWSLTASTGIAPWTTIAGLPSPRTDAAAVAANGKIYILGGRNYAGGGPGIMAAVVDEYDPLTDTWTTGQAAMATPRISHAAAVVNGRVFVMGGRAATDGFNQALDSVEEYEPAMDRWHTRSSMLAPRSFHAVVVVDDKIFALGGDGGSGGGLLGTEVEEYDTVTDTWQARSPMLVPRRDFGAASANGKIYAIGNGIEEYEPTMDSWVWKTSRSVVGTRATSANGKVYVVSGETWAPLFEYDPATNVITGQPGPLTPRYEVAVASWEDKLYTLGGIRWGSGLPDNFALTTAETFDLVAFRTLYVHRKN